MIYIIYTLILLLSISYIQYATGYKWFAMTSYSNNTAGCNYNTTKQITLFQAQKCTQVNTNGVITSYSTDCTIGKDI